MTREIWQAIKNNWRSYTFVPSGETVRALEVAVATAAVQVAASLDWTKLENWKTYAISIAAAGIVAGVAYIKGKIPSTGS